MPQNYDLEERTLGFARTVISNCYSLPRSAGNETIARQLIRSATSIGANYREANDSLGKRDLLMHMRIARKEAKESVYWLELSDPHPSAAAAKAQLVDEATQLMRIFGAIVAKLRF